MKRSGFGWSQFVVPLVLLALLGGCGAAAPGPATAAPGNAGLIVAVSGDAALKRQGWRDFAPVAFGAVFRRGDLVRVGDGGRALVACADLNLAELTGGVKGNPCPAGGPAPLVFEGALVSPTRGGPGRRGLSRGACPPQDPAA